MSDTPTETTFLTSLAAPAADLAPQIPAPSATRLQPVPQGLPDTPAVRERIAAARAEISPNAPGQLFTWAPEQLFTWGVRQQTHLGELGQRLMAQARNKDVGTPGRLLQEIILELKGFNVEEIVGAQARGGLLGKLFRRAALPLALVRERYETVNNQIAAVLRNLDRHFAVLLRDQAALEALYQASGAAYVEMLIYREAALQIGQDLDERVIPELAAAVLPNDPLSTEHLARARRFRQRLEQRGSEFLQTATALFLSLPSITTIEDNDANTLDGIRSTILLAVPLWRQSIAIHMMTNNSLEAARDRSAVTDMINKSLVQTAQHTRAANVPIATENQRSVIDIETIKVATDQAVAMLEERQAIYEQARARRAAEVGILDDSVGRVRRALEGAKPAAESA